MATSDREPGTNAPPSPSPSIDTFQLRIPLDTWAPPPLFAGRPRTHVEAIYVRVATDKGVVGWGECFGSSGRTVIAAFDNWIRHLAVGQDPTDKNLMPRIERLLHGLGRAGAGDARAERARHRAVGHPRQARRRFGVEAARRRQAQAGRNLRLAAAIQRRRRACEAQHRARARARLSPHQAARAHRRGGRRGARGRRVRQSRSRSTPIAPGRRPKPSSRSRDEAVEPVSGSRSRSGRRKISSRWPGCARPPACRSPWARTRPARPTSAR